MSAISDKYWSMGGTASFLGNAVTNEIQTPNGRGFFQHFRGGSIYWSPATGAQTIYGFIRDKWAALGWENSFLGFPTTDEFPTPNGRGRFNHFEGGSIYWSPATGAQTVYGFIRDKWASLGWENGFLGFPITDELPTPNGRGRFNHFEGGSIYWSPATGAQTIYGSIRGKWASLGWENGFLGFPTTDELPTPNGRGRFNHFEGGSIYWSPATDAQTIYGSIRSKWASLGWENSFLGFPTTDELSTPNGRGRFNHFEGGSIYWSPATGAQTIYGFIRDRWAALGWENGFLGFPTTDELPSRAGIGRISHFEHGSIFWSPDVGARELRMAVRLHTKVLTSPTINLDTMLDRMQEVYSTAGIRVDFISNEVLALPLLNDLDVGACTMGGVTAEQTTLFANRNTVGANDMVVYFVRSTVPPFNGCAAHPAGRPGAAVVQGATQWTLAHELGHVLGLNHVNDNNRLMTGNGTGNITNPPPDIINAEAVTMDTNVLTINL